MKKTPIAILMPILSVGLLFVGQQDDANPIKELPVTESTLIIGKTFQLKSKIYNEEREINVWVPPGHDSGDQAYPVLYVIDGGLDQDFHHISGLGQLATINGQFEELIVVGIKTTTRMAELAHLPSDPRYVEYSPIAGKSDLFLKHITDEVFPLIRSKFRTGKRRAVIGESLAGLFIAEVFLKYPETFTDYISISPSLWWDDRSLAKSATELIAKHDDASRKLYLTMANEGGTMQSGLDLVLDAINNNQPKGLEWQYVDRRESELHSTIYHGASYDALTKLFGIPHPVYGEKPWYLVEGGQPAPKKEDAKNEND